MLSDRIGKIEKARQYAAEADRFLIADNHVIVRGEHGDYILRQDQDHDDWKCNCAYYRRHGWCAHTLAFEWYSGARPSIVWANTA